MVVATVRQGRQRQPSPHPPPPLRAPAHPLPPGASRSRNVTSRCPSARPPPASHAADRSAVGRCGMWIRAENQLRALTQRRRGLRAPHTGTPYPPTLRRASPLTPYPLSPYSKPGTPPLPFPPNSSNPGGRSGLIETTGIFLFPLFGVKSDLFVVGTRSHVLE